MQPEDAFGLAYRTLSWSGITSTQFRASPFTCANSSISFSWAHSSTLTLAARLRSFLCSGRSCRVWSWPSSNALDGYNCRIANRTRHLNQIIPFFQNSWCHVDAGQLSFFRVRRYFVTLDFLWSSVSFESGWLSGAMFDCWAIFLFVSCLGYK